MLTSTLDYMDVEKRRMDSQSRSTNKKLQQLLFIVTDGQITESRPELRALLARAAENGQFVTLLLLDTKAAPTTAPDQAVATQGLGTASATQGLGTASAAAAQQPRTMAAVMRKQKAERDARLQRVERRSLLDMQIVEFQGTKVLKRSYFDDFPFAYYLVIQQITQLPEMLADVMRQWFELVSLQ